MKVERAGDLIFWTYYMIDWTKVGQVKSRRRCTQCGGLLNKVETVTDGRGLAYEGLVCHHCRTLLWVRREAGGGSQATTRRPTSAKSPTR